MDNEPIGKNNKFLSKVHVCFDPNFKDLVEKQHQKNKQKRFKIGLHKKNACLTLAMRQCI
jgi:hypothetical protein